MVAAATVLAACASSTHPTELRPSREGWHPDPDLEGHWVRPVEALGRVSVSAVLSGSEGSVYTQVLLLSAIRDASVQIDLAQQDIAEGEAIGTFVRGLGWHLEGSGTLHAGRPVTTHGGMWLNLELHPRAVLQESPPDPPRLAFDLLVSRDGESTRLPVRFVLENDGT